jgi:glycosyltransferase involved in cell wall biosynthesis
MIEDRPTVIIIDDFLAGSIPDAGSQRLDAMVRAFEALDLAVVQIAVHGVPSPVESPVVHMVGSDEIVPTVLALGEQLALVVIARPTNGALWLPVIRHLVPDVPVVYDTVDLHFVREERQNELIGGDGRVASQFRVRELALVASASATLVASPADAATLARLAPAARTFILPTVAVIRDDVPGPDARTGVLFVGNFTHQPNVDAVEWFLDAIWPHLASHAGTYTIVGPHPRSSWARPGVFVTGLVDALEPYYDAARVVVAPLRFGAGMKGKVTEALGAGVPVVGSAIALEGLPESVSTAVTQAEDAASYLEAWAHFADASSWREASTVARGGVRAFASPEAIGRVVAQLVTEVAAPRT